VPDRKALLLTDYLVYWIMPSYFIFHVFMNRFLSAGIGALFAGQVEAGEVTADNVPSPNVTSESVLKVCKPVNALSGEELGMTVEELNISLVEALEVTPAEIEKASIESYKALMSKKAKLLKRLDERRSQSNGLRGDIIALLQSLNTDDPSASFSSGGAHGADLLRFETRLGSISREFDRDVKDFEALPDSCEVSVEDVRESDVRSTINDLRFSAGIVCPDWVVDNVLDGGTFGKKEPRSLASLFKVSSPEGRPAQDMDSSSALKIDEHGMSFADFLTQVEAFAGKVDALDLRIGSFWLQVEAYQPAPLQQVEQ